jgi:hypothetical protein
MPLIKQDNHSNVHHLNDKSTMVSNGRLFDLINCRYDIIKSGIRTDTQLRTWQIVIDRGW